MSDKPESVEQPVKPVQPVKHEKPAEPKKPSIAIIGASNDKTKFGNKAVRAYHQKGYIVYPINPHEETIEGIKAFKSILDIPDPIDIASLYVKPEIGYNLMDDIARKGVKEVYLNPGADSYELYQKAKLKGVTPVIACSILAVGMNPKDL